MGTVNAISGKYWKQAFKHLWRYKTCGFKSNYFFHEGNDEMAMFYFEKGERELALAKKCRSIALDCE